VETRDELGRSALHNACWQGANVDEVRALVSQGASIEARDDAGATPLFYARSIEVAELLLSRGADINAKSYMGKTPLISAIESLRSPETARFLIEKGADVNASGYQGWTALHHAAVTAGNFDNGKSKHYMTDDQLGSLSKILIDHGANVEATISDDGSRYALATPLHLAVDGNNVHVVNQLLASAADVNTRKRDGISPLGLAILGDRMKLAELLVDAGARVEPSDALAQFEPRWMLDRGVTLLHVVAHYCAESGTRLAEMLILGGSDVNSTSARFGHTPLMCAIVGTPQTVVTRSRRLQMVELLMRHGADPQCTDRKGKSALDIATNQASWAIHALNGKVPTVSPPTGGRSSSPDPALQEPGPQARRRWWKVWG
jgi:ankyrin repeat protein